MEFDRVIPSLSFPDFTAFFLLSEGSARRESFYNNTDLPFLFGTGHAMTRHSEHCIQQLMASLARRHYFGRVSFQQLLRGLSSSVAISCIFHVWIHWDV
jgi:hypothetical protein